MPRRRNPREDPELATDLLALAERAHALRLQRGWTLEETAERSDLDVRHVQLLEAGTGNPTTATLLRLARGLGISPVELFGGVPQLGTAMAPLSTSPPSVSAMAPPLPYPNGDGHNVHECCQCIAGFGLQPGSFRVRHDDPRIDRTCAARIRALRLSRDWSQSELARRAELSTGAVQALEAATKSPTLRTLDAVARAFELPAWALLLAIEHIPPEMRARAGRR